MKNLLIALLYQTLACFMLYHAINADTLPYIISFGAFQFVAMMYVFEGKNESY